MPSNGPAPDGPRPPASPAGPPASNPTPEPDAAKPLPWPWTEETAEHVLAISLERLEEIERLRAEIGRLKRAAPGPATEEMLAWAGGLIEEVRDGCGPVAGVRVFGKLKVFVRVTDVP